MLGEAKTQELSVHMRLEILESTRDTKSWSSISYELLQSKKQ